MARENSLLPLCQKVSRSPSSGAAWLAGEASGDLLASLILPRLERAMGGALQFGVGGERMQRAGLLSWYPSDILAVRGYVEVLAKLPRILWLRQRMLSRLRVARPRVFIGVDAPDFNLSLELRLRRQGIKTVHLVSPAVWAWRPERLSLVAKAVDHALLIFPFEADIYERAGIPATYIGHPLAEIIPERPDPAAARARLDIDPEGEPLFAVLPGSRADEVDGCGPIFLATCRAIRRRLGEGGRFAVPAADAARKAQLESLLKSFPDLAPHVTVVEGHSHDVLEACDAALVASGTAALEAALFRKPLVVGYAMPALSAALIRRKGLIPWVSLPNILAGKMVVPEFLHYFCEPEAMAARLLDEAREERAGQLREIFTGMRESLRRPTAELAVSAIMGLLN